MRRGTAGLLALASMVAPAAAGDEPPKAKGAPAVPARDAEFQRKVDGAIARGVLWLQSRQTPSGGFLWYSSGIAEGTSIYEFGTTSLAVHALRSCGAAADDPVVKGGVARMRAIWRSGVARQTYEVSLGLLALEAHYAPPPAAPGKAMGPGKAPPGPRDIPKADFDWIREMARWLVVAQSPSGSFGYMSPDAGWGDLSNTQYALLGLKAARRCGVEVRKEVFRKAAEFVLGCQEPSGPKVARTESSGVDEHGYARGRSRSAVMDTARGFGYQSYRMVSGSMTAAGISSLVICRGELPGLPMYTEKSDAVLVRGIRDGIAWLGHNFRVTGNPGENGTEAFAWHYYYLYGLERAGVLAGVLWMGARDWYLEGAAYLVRNQNEKGAWQSAGGLRGRRGGGRTAPGDLLDSCFALLFLKKATFRVEGAVATEEADDALDLGGAADLDEDSFRAVFDTVFARYARAGADRRGSLVSDFVRLGLRGLPFLVRTLEDADPARRAAAIEALERVTGATQGFVADAPEEARAAAVVAWEEWWFAHRSRLVADPDAGRFRE